MCSWTLSYYCNHVQNSCLRLEYGKVIFKDERLLSIFYRSLKWWADRSWCFWCVHFSRISKKKHVWSQYLQARILRQGPDLLFDVALLTRPVDSPQGFWLENSPCCPLQAGWCITDNWLHSWGLQAGGCAIWLWSACPGCLAALDRKVNFHSKIKAWFTGGR